MVTLASIVLSSSESDDREMTKELTVFHKDRREKNRLKGVTTWAT